MAIQSFAVMSNAQDGFITNRLQPVSFFSGGLLRMMPPHNELNPLILAQHKLLPLFAHAVLCADPHGKAISCPMATHLHPRVKTGEMWLCECDCMS